MKKIQRYTVGTADPEAIVKDNKGWLVSYDDYAALKAENERLRMAGDELLLSFKQTESAIRTIKASADWLAAKGGQS